jgi:hypothetical protein
VAAILGTIVHGFKMSKGIFSICRGVPLRSPHRAGARPCPYPKLLRRYFVTKERTI